MNCLVDFIGLKGCGINTPDSAAYINELPGVSLKTIDNIASAEQINFLGVWQDVQTRALRKFTTDTRNYLSKEYKLNTPLETVNIGTGVNITETTPGDNKFRGVYSETLYGSQLQQTHLQEINIYLLANESNVTFVVKELSNKNIWYTLYTKVIDLVAGWNNFYIGENFTAEKLFFGYDCTGIVAPELLLQNNCCGLGCCDMNISGATTDFTTIQKGTNTFGLSLVFGSRCSWEAFICNNKSIFTQSLLLLHGIELMSERIHSQRLNQYTMFGVDKAKELRDELIAQYQTEMISVFESISFNQDCCIECNAQVTYKDRRP